MFVVVTYQNSIIAKGQIGSEVISLENNYYFSKSCVDFSHLKMKENGGQYFCPIKQGSCDYYNFVDDSGKTLIDEIGWIYENPKFMEICKGKIAFYKNKGFEIRSE
jgi:uncharacterized protein (DUF427 family)